jgi:sodium/proline symporter
MMDMNYYHGAILGFLIVLAYIFIGGFVAVVWSDLFQGVLMFFGLVILPIVVYYNLDANLNILDTLHTLDPKLTNIWGGEGFWLNLATILGFSMIGLGFLGSPQVYVRFMSIKNEDEITKGKWVAIFYTLLTDAAAVTIGILARVYFTENGQDPEAVFGTGATDVLNMVTTNFLPLGIAAIYVAIVLSAIMSTIDSLLVMASSAVTRDFYQKIFNPSVSDGELTKISRYVTLIMALLALGLAFGMAYFSPDRQVFWVMIFGWSGIAASFCPVIILSLFWKEYSEAGAVASIISGFLGVILFKFVVNELDVIGIYFDRLDVLAPSFVVSLFFGWLFTKLYPIKKESIAK